MAVNNKNVKKVICWEAHPGPQTVFLNSKEFEVFYGGSRGGGKSLSYDAEIITPFGLSTMADMRVGSLVSNPDGSVANVIGVYPQPAEELYRVTFIDGSQVKCTADHLWLARKTCRKMKADRRHYPFRLQDYVHFKIYTTRQLFEHLDSGVGGSVLTPLSKPVEFTRTSRWPNRFPVDPYVLGVLLGDGSCTDTPITFSTNDEFILHQIENKIGKDRVRQYGKINFGIVGMGDDVRKAGIFGKTALHKFIPEAYKYGPISVRKEVLAGLNDTDGYVDNRGHCSFTTISPKLAEDVQFIARSLGYKATISRGKAGYKTPQGEYRQCNDAYDVYFQGPNTRELFNLPRKKDRTSSDFNGGVSTPHRRITNIERCGREESQCIKVDHPNGLFLTNGFVVTHNTAALIAYMLLYAANPNYSGLLLRRTFPQLLQVRLRAKKLYTKVDPGCHFNKDDNVFELSSGATIQLGHVQHDDDVERYQGFEFQICGFEELTQFKEQHYEAIKLSCRSGDSGMIPMVRATGNPRGIGHAFVKKRFINLGPPGTIGIETLPDGRQLTRKFVRARVYDNPTLMKNDPQYVAVLMGIKDPKLRAAMLEGDWDAAEGMFFSDFSKDTLIKPLVDIFPSGKPDDGMPVYASLDWGYSKPFAIYWHAINRYDKVITFKEWYGIKTDPLKNEYMDNVGIQMLDEDVAREFLRRSEGMNIEYLVADPSIKIRSGAAKNGAPSSIYRTFQEILGNAGIPVILGNNDRKSGWMQVKSRMQNAPDGSPWWIITDNCRHLIRTIPDLPEDINDPDDLDSQAEDHAADSVRYFFQQFPMDNSKKPSGIYQHGSSVEVFRTLPRGLDNQLGSLASTYH